jgi:hypothetical protein
MKSQKIAYWAPTIFIFIFEGVIPALTSNSQLAADGIRHLGYPDYFRVMLTIFKVIGALAIILPMVKDRFKEWAYAGFGITFISAAVSHWVNDGLTVLSFFPVIVFGLLIISYVFYHKLNPAS